jgi:divalent metal cation (Fe/Co/Zn/Cd) transporter
MADEKSQVTGQGEGGSKVAADTTHPNPEGRHMIPVWFFVGVLLLIYGILILIEGISEWSNPPKTVLSNLHPTLWWSFVLIILGGIFSWKHFPGKNT